MQKVIERWGIIQMMNGLESMLNCLFIVMLKKSIFNFENITSQQKFTILNFELILNLNYYKIIKKIIHEFGDWGLSPIPKFSKVIQFFFIYQIKK